MAKNSRSALNINLILVLLLGASVAWTAEVATNVTKIEVYEREGVKYADVVLNDNLLIAEIKVAPDRKTGNIILQYPDYVNKHGQSIPQVEITGNTLPETIRQAVVSNRLSLKKPVDINYKIVKINLFRQKGSSLKAFIEVLFNQAIRVEARVMESKNPPENGEAGRLWVAWPGRKDRKGKWVNQFDILKYDVKQAIEKAVIEKYKVVKSEEP